MKNEFIIYWHSGNSSVCVHFAHIFSHSPQVAEMTGDRKLCHREQPTLDPFAKALSSLEVKDSSSIHKINYIDPDMDVDLPFVLWPFISLSLCH